MKDLCGCYGEQGALLPHPFWGTACVGRGAVGRPWRSVAVQNRPLVPQPLGRALSRGVVLFVQRLGRRGPALVSNFCRSADEGMRSGRKKRMGRPPSGDRPSANPRNFRCASRRARCRRIKRPKVLFPSAMAFGIGVDAHDRPTPVVRAPAARLWLQHLGFDSPPTRDNRSGQSA
jgi:hypothetical protein